jgi:glycine cleavage system pyridoxal-binding protein P
VERKGVFSFRAADGSSIIVSVPSLLNTKVIDETNVINKADAAVTSFINAMLDTSLTLITPSSHLGSNIVMVDKAVKTHRGSRRG